MSVDRGCPGARGAPYMRCAASAPLGCAVRTGLTGGVLQPAISLI
jgi:hypothetical protein